MPLFASSPLLTSRTDKLRSMLIAALHERHRPELGDLVASADLLLDGTGLWVGAPESVNSAWLSEELLGAALEAGVPIQRIQILPQSREERV